MLRRLKSLSFGDKIALSAIVVIAVLTHVGWLFDFSIFTSGDWWYISQERYRDFARFSAIWVTEGMGTSSAVPPFYFIRFLEGLLVLLGGSFALTEKVFFFMPIIFASSIGMYVFARQYFQPGLAFVASIVFCFNTAVLFNYAGALTIATAYAFTPMALYTFRQLIIRPTSKRLIVANALLIAIIMAYEQRIVLLVLGMAVGLLAFKILTASEKKRYAQQRVVSITVMLLLVGGLHAFWLLPYILNAQSGVGFSDLLSRDLFESFSDIKNSLTLYHPFWTGGRPATFVEQGIPWLFWIVPIIAFGGLVFMRYVRTTFKNYQEMFYWAIIAVVGIFLVKQVNEPFTNVYPWLYAHVPGSAAFREASKFYLLNIIGFSLLIPFALYGLRVWLSKRLHHRDAAETVRLGFWIASAAVVVFFLANAWPLMTGSFRTLYVAREIPADYAKFNNFIARQPGHFRILWTPTSSRWGAQSDRHPSVTPAQLSQGAWWSLLDADEKDPFPTLRDKSAQLFAHSSSDAALDRASIKYVVVPIRDTQSEDDFLSKYGDDREFYINTLKNAPFLRRIDIGTHELAVFENQNYTPHISSFDTLQAFNAAEPSSVATAFELAHEMRQPFNYTNSRDKLPADYPKTTTEDIFHELRPEEIQQGQVVRTIPTKQNDRLLIRGENRRLSYEIKNAVLTFYERKGHDLKINGNTVGDSKRQIVATVTLDATRRYHLVIGDTIVPLQTENTRRSLGVVSENVALYSSGKNTIANPSFEKDLWQQSVEDCNKYNDKPDIGMSQESLTASKGAASLQLDALSHTACTNTGPIPVAARDYLFNLDYQIVGGKTVGFAIEFDDQARTRIQRTIDTNRTYWQQHRQVVHVPPGARHYTVKVFGYPDYLQKQRAYTNYDNIKMVELEQVMAVPTDKNAFVSHSLPPGSAEIRYDDTNIKAKNLVQNGDFEKSLWQPTVGNCNRYDGKANIGMKAHQRSTANKALELSAHRHAACTSQRITVKEAQQYLLRFEYQSPNAKIARYRLEFDDPAKTSIDGQAPVKAKTWLTHTRQIKVPLGATKVNIIFFAYENAYKTQTIVNRFDTVSLQRVPPLTGTYFVVQAPQQKLKKPARVAFTLDGATKKNVTVTGATHPFYLSMSEAYNQQWQASLREDNIFSWLPFTPRTAVADAQHFRLNEFENGWYIDPAALCMNASPACQKHDDGSYSLLLTIEFKPQRWFYIGVIVSAITIVGCVYILWRAPRARTK